MFLKQEAETLRGLTVDMHALMEDNCTDIVCTDSMVCRKRQKLNFFQHRRIPTFISWEWLPDLFMGGKVQIGQTSLFPVLSMDAFRKMQNLKFLQLNYMKFYGSYEHFPKNLVWLCWHGFSLRSLPKLLCLEKLVVLDLSRSNLVDAWKTKMSLPKLKILDLRHSHDLLRTPDFSGLPNLEKLILEDCIHLVQIHKSIGDLQNLLILNLKNCTSLVELPEEVSRMNSLEKLFLDGCSNLDSLNMELEHHRGHRLLQSDGIVVASTSYITSWLLKLFYSSFSEKKNSRFSRFSLPHSLTTLNLRGTPIRFLPESIKILSTLRYLGLKECKMLQTLPELPPNLFLLDVSWCYSLQRLANLTPIIQTHDGDQFVQLQDWMKLELIQKVDLHMWRIMQTVNIQMQPFRFQIRLLKGNIFSVLLNNKGNVILRFYEEKEDEWIIQDEFVECMSFKISSPAGHRICGVKLFTCFTAMTLSNLFRDVYFEIRNNTKGRGRVFYPSDFPIFLTDEKFELFWLNHWIFGGYDLEFDNGDEFSVSVFTNNPCVQIKRVGVRMLHEEEGIDDNIQSNNEVISSSNSEVITTHSSGDDEHVAKAEIASHIFRNYYITLRHNDDNLDQYWCFFERKSM
ncbi:disease resistance protein RPP2B-like [Populus alba x Populus x berolinensis]|nr:disease resistance protein RPP2B-like [Populus alba x Populus x berolinensis]